MAEIINFKSSGNWNSLQDPYDASPAEQTRYMTKTAETMVKRFDINDRLATLNKLGTTALTASAEKLAA